MTSCDTSETVAAILSRVIVNVFFFKALGQLAFERESPVHKEAIGPDFVKLKPLAL